MTGYFLQALIFLLAAVCAVPIAKKAGLGSVLGYLIAGVVIGPIFNLINNNDNAVIQHFAEFGVVMMLFLVGLELNPSSLWEMRHKLLGLGSLQVILTTLIVAVIGYGLNQPWQVAVVTGFIFSVSSTAIVLQTFNEKKLNNTEGAKSAFSVLLFQDIAVIPMLAVIPLLYLPELAALGTNATVAGDLSVAEQTMASLNSLQHAAVVALVIGAVVCGSKYLSTPLFKYIASTGLHEMFTASALLIVISITVVMNTIGLSPALGVFLAGIILGGSEFKHELECNIEPFKGLLLGVFFITVGAAINFDVLLDNPYLIIGATIGLMTIKAVVLLALTYIFKIKSKQRWLFSLSLAQAGEFGFVLLNYSTANYVLPQDLAEKLSLVVALSMFLTPGIFVLLEKFIMPMFKGKVVIEGVQEDIPHANVIIAGVGRFGQIVERILNLNGLNTVAIDNDAKQIINMKKINKKAYYGDVNKPSLLDKAGIDNAQIFVIGLSNRENSISLTKYIKRTYPHVKILARAFDRGHHYQLKNAGADYVISETYLSAVELGTVALNMAGVSMPVAQKKKEMFLEEEYKGKEVLYKKWADNYEQNKHRHRFEDISYTQLYIEIEEQIRQQMKQ